MKCTLIVITGLMWALLSFAEDHPSTGTRFFKIPEKTAVRVRTKNGITSETAHVGDDVPMEVLEDVIVNGYVVIREGASAIGQISKVREARSLAGVDASR